MPSRLNWCPEEQSLLKCLKQEQNISSWKKIAQVLNEKFLDSSRTGKQCRDRYINYVRFNPSCPKIVGWTPQEDKILFEKFKEYGAKWVQISSQMPGRSENNLKNRFYGAIRKIIRKMAKVEREMKPKPKKSIKERQLIKVLEECRNNQQIELMESEVEGFGKFARQLYQNLFVFAVSQQDQITNQEVKIVFSMIHEYNNIKSKLAKRRSSSSCELSTENEIKQMQVPSSSTKTTQEKEQSAPTYYQIDFETIENSVLSWEEPFKNEPEPANCYLNDFWKYESELFRSIEGGINRKESLQVSRRLRDFTL